MDAAVVNWELCPIPVGFNCFQRVDGELLLKIIASDCSIDGVDVPSWWKDTIDDSNDEALQKKTKKSKKTSTVKTYTSKLSRFMNAFMKSGPAWEKRTSTQWCRTVSYNFAEKKKDVRLGRLYSVPSGQMLPKSIRDALFHQSVTIDMVNCHYSLLWNFLCLNGFDVSGLGLIKSYAESPVDMRRVFIDQYPSGACSGLIAKTFFISLLFGKFLGTWEHENNLPISSELIRSFCAQVDRVRQMIQECPEVVSKLPPIDNATEPVWVYRNRVMSSLLENIETIIMMHCIKSIRATHGDESVHLYVFDGLEVDRENADSILSSLPGIVFEKFGYRVDFSEKPKDGAIVDQFSTVESEEDKSYAAIKCKFEQTNFKTLNPPLYWTYHVDPSGVGNYQSYDESKFRSKWGHKQFANDETSRLESFIPKWLADDTIRLYEKAGIYPDRKKCPADTFNLYTGLAAESIPFTPSDWTDADLDERCELIIQLLRYLTENEEHTQFVLDYFGHLMQYPQTKPRVCLVFHSNFQGTGKQLFMDSISKCIGKRYFAETSSPEHDLFGPFNSLIKNKFVTVLDESSVVKQAHMERFKNYITSPWLVISQKFHDAENFPDYNRFILTTNNPHPILLADSERRIAVTTTTRPELPGDFSAAYRDALEDPVTVRCWFELLRRRNVPEDYGFGPNRPMSSLYNSIREASVDVELQFLVYYITENMFDHASSASWIPSRAASASLSTIVQSNRRREIKITTFDLYTHYAKYLETHGYQFKSTCTLFSTRLKQLLCGAGDAFVRDTTWSQEFRGKVVWTFDVTKMMSFFVDKKYIAAAPPLSSVPVVPPLAPIFQ